MNTENIERVLCMTIIDDVLNDIFGKAQKKPAVSDGLVIETIAGRRSVRNFLKDDVPKEALDKIIEAMRLAPSAGNLQSRFFYFVRNTEKRAQLSKAAHNQRHVAEAPVCIVACTDERISQKYGQQGVDVYSLIDVAAAVENSMLVAHSLGLGTCWIGAMDEAEVKRILDIPNHLRPISMIPLGYPASRPKMPARKETKDIARIVD